jgi:AraC-like DNA-binding protein
MIEILYIGSIFFSLITVYILLFKQNAFRSNADYTLAAYFIVALAGIIMYLLVYSGLINQAPYLYKSTGPLNFLTPVLSYLYVRGVLFNEKRFTIKDLPHLIPFFLVVLSYIPFYILPIAEKAVIVKAISSNLNLTLRQNLGLVPERFVYMCVPIQIVFYIVLQWNLIIKYKKINKFAEVQNQIIEVIKWLKIFTTAGSFYVFGAILLLSGSLYNPSFFNTPAAVFIPGIALSASFLIISAYLLINPTILLGLPFIKYKEIESVLQENEVDSLAFIKDDYSKEISTIDDYFIKEKKYLNPELNLSTVAVELKLPARDLSYIIYNYYGFRFNEFLNKFRIEYITNKMNVSFLNNYTIEGISKEAGFNTKSTFYRAFKKIHGISPVEYLEQLGHHKSA